VAAFRIQHQFKRLHRDAPFPPQEMNTIEQARRVLDRAFIATIANNYRTAM
jgi:hypothetical protein